MHTKRNIVGWIVSIYAIVALASAQTNTNSANNLYSFTVLPSNSYIDINGSFLTQASPQACFADCQSCQILTNLCE